MDSLISRLHRRNAVSVQTGILSARKVVLCVDDVQAWLSVIPCVDDVQVLRELGTLSWTPPRDAHLLMPRRIKTCLTGRPSSLSSSYARSAM